MIKYVLIFLSYWIFLPGPKNDPPVALQEKVLAMIQSWAEAFCHDPELSGVSQVYADLKHRKFEFPSSQPDSAVPIITPKRVNDLNVLNT